VVDAVEAAQKGEVLAATQDAPAVTIIRSLPHGHVAVHAMARTLGMPALLGPAGRQRDLPLALSKAGSPRYMTATARTPGEPVNPARHAYHPQRSRASPSQSRPDRIALRIGGGTPPDPRTGSRPSACCGSPARAAVTDGSWGRLSTQAVPASTICAVARFGRQATPRPSPGKRCAGGPSCRSGEQLTAAIEVLRADPDTDTVLALDQLTALEAFAWPPDADRLTLEVPAAGQAAGVGTDQLAGLFEGRDYYLDFADRRREAAAYFRECARLGEEIDSTRLGCALLNLSATLCPVGPAVAAEIARTAAEHLAAPAPETA
jgi:hypothetical protein